MNNKIVYTSHALLRLKVRNIGKTEVDGILKQPQKLYFDTATGASIAVGPRTLQGHWLIVVYLMEDGVIKIMTVIDTSSINSFIKKRLDRGRWIEAR